ncbi:MAG: MFS transporter [Bacteroidales bacterium]|nr:MFS transporter [Bacteroidales bacterium]
MVLFNHQMLLLLVIYIAFIGLGLPDSLFGTAWPAIYANLGLPFSFGSFVTLMTSMGTVFSSLKSDSVIKRWGTHRVTLVSTALTAIAILGMALSGNFLFFCLCAIPLGLGAGAIDTALNNYVALHYTSAQMNFLHCFYGLGVTLSPFILSIMLQGEGGWRGGYNTVFLIQLGITALLLVSYPLWKKKNANSDNASEINTLSTKEVLQLKGIVPMLTFFFASVALEMSCGAWGATYLVENLQMTNDGAASTVMFYFIGIAIGRFLSGILAIKLHGWRIIRYGMVVLLAALVLLISTKDALLTTIALMLIGIGNGPMFPNFCYLTPEIFGEENSTSVMGIQIAVANISMMLMPVLCGLFTQWLSMSIFPYFLLIFYAGMAIAMYAKRK